MIASAWKLTYDPAGTPEVLLAYDQIISEELGLSLEKAVELVALVDGAAPFVRVGKNAVTSISGTIISETPTTDAAARAAMLDALIAAQTATRKPLRVEIQGITAFYWQFASATIKRHAPRRMLEMPSAAWSVQLDIVATGLFKTAVP